MQSAAEEAREGNSRAKILGKWRVPFFYGWLIVGVVFVSQFTAAGLGGATLSLFFKTMSADTGWSLASLLGAVTAQSIVSTIAAPVLGPMMDRLGVKSVMLFGAIGSGIGLLALSQVHQLWQFWVLYALSGALGLSELGPLTGPVAVSKWFIRKRGRAMAIATSGTAVGAMIMSPVLAFLITTVGWRHTWTIVGLAALVTMVPLVLLFMRQQPEEVGLLPDGDTAGATVLDKRGVAVLPKEDMTWTLRQALRTRTLWVLIIAMNLASLSAGALIYLQVPFMISKGMSVQGAGLVFTLTWTGFAISRVVWGFLVERLPVRWCLGGAFLARAMGPVFLVALPFPFSIAPFLICYGMFGGSFQLLQAVAFADYFGRRFQGTIQGVLRPLLNIPNLVGPLFLAWLIDRTGSYTPAFLIVGVLGIGAAAVALFATVPKLAATRQAAEETARAA